MWFVVDQASSSGAQTNSPTTRREVSSRYATRATLAKTAQEERG
jgi:hypothetical protein